MIRPRAWHAFTLFYLLWAICAGAVIARADSVHQYARQPVNRVIDPLMRQILTEMDVTLRSVTPTINTVITTSGGGSFKDNAFSLYDDGDASKLLAFQLSGLTTLTTRTLTVPNADGTLPLLGFSQLWSGANFFRDDRTWIQDEADTSKRVAFQASGITTGTTRTLTVPNASGTLPLLNLAQTFTTTQTITPATDVNGLKLIGTNVATQDLLQIYESGGNKVCDFTSLGAFEASSPRFYNGYIGSGGDVTVDLSLLTASRLIQMPDLNGVAFAFTSGAQTLNSKTLSTTGNTFRASTAATGCAFVDNTSTAKALRFVLSGLTASTNNSLTFSATAARDWKFGDVPGAVTITGNGANPPATGAVGKVDALTQTADIASTKLTDTTPTGMYQVEAILEDIAADLTAGIVTVTFSWTDDAGATTDATLTQALTAAGRSRLTLPLYLASGNITYATSHTGIFGTSTYTLRIRCTYKG